MKLQHRKKEETLPRQSLPLFRTNPEQGLNAAQVRERIERGWVNESGLGAGKS